MKDIKWKILPLLIALLVFCNKSFAQNGIKSLTPQEYKQAIQNDPSAIVLDVRQPQEYKMGHIKGAILINVLDEPLFEQEIKKLDKNKTYYLYCRSGKRSNKAALKMQKMGFKVWELKGGIKSWTESKMPIEK
ncbi:hypothetical protein HQ36_00650 [Porphyromonas gingivicanis]|uniref:Rhodanese domain-containing protein n=1 Tax=Porphyromonas gingivicanis TaxID=266762 RepID=A0A0A2G9B1_9PORP|nr:rhodanese-like domain-containing protein [Porphyromonas gingivicanis]KGN99022.1 hypothetical protein HQ36_00650 [Porphyromonas gingivicanis]